MLCSYMYLKIRVAMGTGIRENVISYALILCTLLGLGLALRSIVGFV